MSGVIYYFTGTGNSLFIAKNLAAKINAELVPIPEVTENAIKICDRDTIGIVFPVYHQGLPSIVKRFVHKLDGLEGKYLFGICTYGDSSCLSLEYLSNYLKARGGILSLGYGVRMPYNYITPSFVLKDFYKSFKLREIRYDRQEQMFKMAENKLEEIFQDVMGRKRRKIETKAQIIEKLVDFFNLKNTLQKRQWLKIAGVTESEAKTFEDCIRLMDKGFWPDKNCNGCGICSKVCPVKNIRLENNSPLWQGQCEQCFRCLQWCPRQAVQFREGTLSGKRYHHPEINLSEILLKE